MSDGEQPEAPAVPGRPEDVALSYGTPDEFLQLLVDLVNQTGGLEIGVTLHVSGVVVSGLLISGRRYFELVNEGLQVAGPQELAPVREALGTAFTTAGDSYRADEFTDEAGPDQYGRLSIVTYIHLRDGMVYAPGAAPLPGMLWRGRLSHVSGWSLGNYDAMPRSTERPL